MQRDLTFKKKEEIVNLQDTDYGHTRAKSLINLHQKDPRDIHFLLVSPEQSP